ncbi:MAG: hypothetical protein IJT40_04985 [Firmicutes bacterium]|nr:hypothetical protein [Bacillota bacterium]
MAVKMNTKPAATAVKANFYFYIEQEETVNGANVQALRRMSEAVYEWSALPLDIRTAITILVNAVRQQGWSASADLTNAINTLETAVNADFVLDRARLTALETWKTLLSTLITGTKTLTNTQEFPFNNSEASVTIATQANANYIVLTEVTSAVGNVGEVIVSNKSTTGFKLAYTGSASTATIKYTVLTGFAS